MRTAKHELVSRLSPCLSHYLEAWLQLPAEQRKLQVRELIKSTKKGLPGTETKVGRSSPPGGGRRRLALPPLRCASPLKARQGSSKKRVTFSPILSMKSHQQREISDEAHHPLAPESSISSESSSDGPKSSFFGSVWSPRTPPALLNPSQSDLDFKVPRPQQLPPRREQHRPRQEQHYRQEHDGAQPSHAAVSAGARESSGKVPRRGGNTLQTELDSQSEVNVSGGHPMVDSVSVTNRNEQAEKEQLTEQGTPQQPVQLEPRQQEVLQLLSLWAAHQVGQEASGARLGSRQRQQLWAQASAPGAELEGAQGPIGILSADQRQQLWASANTSAEMDTSVRGAAALQAPPQQPKRNIEPAHLQGVSQTRRCQHLLELLQEQVAQHEIKPGPSERGSLARRGQRRVVRSGELDGAERGASGHLSDTAAAASPAWHISRRERTVTPSDQASQPSPGPARTEELAGSSEEAGRDEGRGKRHKSEELLSVDLELKL